jgi:hypothetical protein
MGTTWDKIIQNETQRPTNRTGETQMILMNFYQCQHPGCDTVLWFGKMLSSGETN